MAVLVSKAATASVGAVTVTGVEAVESLPLPELLKLSIQLLIGAATVWKMFRKEKKKDENSKVG